MHTAGFQPKTLIKKFEGKTILDLYKISKLRRILLYNTFFDVNGIKNKIAENCY